MKFSGNGLQVLQYFEDCELEAYPDPGTKGPPWTIGWGHTGPDVVPGLAWTRERADEVLLDVDLPPREQAVEQMATVPMTQGQFDGLVDFAYNKGIGALRRNSRSGTRLAASRCTACAGALRLSARSLRGAPGRRPSRSGRAPREPLRGPRRPGRRGCVVRRWLLERCHGQ